MAYNKTRNTGTRNSGTRNTSETAEHPGTITEHQRNTSGTPRNIGTLHEEEQLRLNVYYKLKLYKHLASLLKRAERKVNAFLRRLPEFWKNTYIHELSYVTVGFYYFPSVRMFCSHKMNNKISNFQERCLHMVWSDTTSSFGKLLETDRSVPIHIRNLQVIAAGHSKEIKSLTLTIFSDFFSKTKCSV